MSYRSIQFPYEFQTYDLGEQFLKVELFDSRNHPISVWMFVFFQTSSINMKLDSMLLRALIFTFAKHE